MGQSTAPDPNTVKKIKKMAQKVKKIENKGSTAHDPNTVLDIESIHVDCKEYIDFTGINFESLKKDKNGKHTYYKHQDTHDRGKGTEYNLNRWNNDF